MVNRMESVRLSGQMRVAVAKEAAPDWRHACGRYGAGTCWSCGSSTGWGATARTWAARCRTCRIAGWVRACSPANVRRSTPPRSVVS